MKVYAKISAVIRTETSHEYEVDYTLLYGDRRSDRKTFAPAAYSNESFLLYGVKQQLKAHLNSVYAPEAFATADIVLFGG